ncbi:CRISPR-associated protein Cas4 [Candidatus Poribacteria bacterium]|nr:MAG: CRISPR-associated protein Cas4 [Candidatus Poribacteria bacterium]
MQNPNQPHITGTAINYLYICERKLWFFQNHLEMEHTSEYVDIGQLLHEDTYPREKRREWLIDGMVRIDFVDKDGILHDIKSGPAMETAHVMQLCYYLYLLKQKGVTDRKGVINYPRQRRTTEVELTVDRERELETAIEKVTQIAALPTPPHADYMKICKSCSYQELCWS